MSEILGSGGGLERMELSSRQDIEDGIRTILGAEAPPELVDELVNFVQLMVKEVLFLRTPWTGWRIPPQTEEDFRTIDGRTPGADESEANPD